jgi:hypothetical protein
MAIKKSELYSSLWSSARAMHLRFREIGGLGVPIRDYSSASKRVDPQLKGAWLRGSVAQGLFPKSKVHRAWALPECRSGPRAA